MAARRSKPRIITFKADPSLLESLEGMSNRSQFIRAALLAALDGACPLCKGSGILTPNQKSHWEVFALDHALRKCDDCRELHLVCAKRPRKTVHRQS